LGKICPLGGMFTPSFTPRGEHSTVKKNWGAHRELPSPGDKFTSRGQISPLGDNFAPGVKVCP
jgi:hypothetical protein